MAMFIIIDDYGIKNYTTKTKVLTAFIVLYTYITLMAYPLYLTEVGIGNVTTYGEAFYLLQMTISTVGFGDFYPSTTLGRNIIAMSFYIGVGLAGYIGASIADHFTRFTNTGVANRELRKQNEEILKLLKEKHD